MSLYRMIVVDDEELVREAIRSSIPWDKYGVELVRCAANAPEALAYLETHAAELVVTDIRMPVIDGLELVSRLRKQYENMEFIIISGYADFEYARTAMRFGVRDYLLKPVDTNTLINAVCAARDEWALTRADGTPPDAQNRLSSKNYSPTVSRLLSIVDEELANEQVSLKWISGEKMFLNENYMGRLFQQETGMRFTQYLYAQRMGLAARLMRAEPDMLIADLAQQTGYGGNAQYFSLAFKKYYGCTPSEYRKKLGKE